MGLTTREKLYLKSVYYDVTRRGAFRGPESLYNFVKEENKFNISKPDIKNWLRGESVYTRWKPARRNYARNSINAQYPGHLMQFDLADFHNEPEPNPETGRKFQYLLVCIDSFSRFAFCVPLEDRKAKNVVDGLSTVFKKGYRPHTALSDPAGEHVSAYTKKFFKSQGIHLYFTASKIHAPQAERFIRTLRTALRRYRAAENTKKWMFATEQIVKNYNNSVNRSHNLKPVNVIKHPESALKAYKNLFLSSNKDKKLSIGHKKQQKKNKDKLPKAGEYVRLSRIKHPFEKESTEHGNWTREIFKIVSVNKNHVVPMFKLEDVRGKPVKGKAYLEEIQVVKYDPAQFFEVEKILKHEKRGNVAYVFVKWKGYNNKFNSWLLASDVVELPAGVT